MKCCWFAESTLSFFSLKTKCLFEQWSFLFTAYAYHHFYLLDRLSRFNEDPLLAPVVLSRSPERPPLLPEPDPWLFNLKLFTALDRPLVWCGAPLAEASCPDLEERRLPDDGSGRAPALVLLLLRSPLVPSPCSIFRASLLVAVETSTFGLDDDDDELDPRDASCWCFNITQSKRSSYVKRSR